MQSAILVANVLVTGYLTGLIWCIQRVHYPLFAEVGKGSFARYHSLHVHLISPIVAAPMIAELGLSVLLIRFHPAAFPTPLAWLCCGLVGLIWLSTYFLSVPLHARLDQVGYDAGYIHRLVAMNWLRTAGWTLRLALLTYGLLALLQ